ncbi:hypothetical protein [Nocardia sp. NBC_00403]|uniref:hypothetical protein n=1 Tax=Nocardia sp. NBC_00403 TaxID=2975990 RepID=UPI002E206332
MSVRIGPRDMWAVQWIAEMRGVPMTVLAALLSTSENNAYRVWRRLRKAGLVLDVHEQLRPVPGPSWVVPTAPIASKLLQFEVDEWLPRPKDARHHEMVALTRLALAGNEIGSDDGWISERLLWHANAGQVPLGASRPHLHDGQWTDNLGRLHAIEVELTRKGSSDARTTLAAAYKAAAQVKAHDLIYYCDSPEVATRVRAAASVLPQPGPGDPGLLVKDLNQLLNPPAVDGQGLRAAGGAAS